MIELKHLYFGIVEDVNDPFFFGRLKVRVFGVHNKDLTSIPVASLPWCDLLMPLPNPFISGVGMSPTGMVQGAMVALIPRDPDLLQEWIVVGSVGGMSKAPATGGFKDPQGLYPRASTNHDTNILARGPAGATVTVLGESSVGIGQFPSGYGAAVDKIANRTTDTVQTPIDTGTPPAPPPPIDTTTPWMPLALKALGVNSTDNPDVIQGYHTRGGGSSLWSGAVPWCASFVGSMLVDCGLKGTGSAAARSYCNYGVDVLGDKTKIPYGAIIVVQGNRGPSSGHVCFCTSVANGRVNVIGGNQSAGSSQTGGKVTNSSFPLTAVISARMPPGFGPSPS